jgi:glyceraldehyde 3-phosphate dehydrogenase
MTGRLDGSALRVPVADGSITDLTALVGGRPGAEEVNAAFRRASEEGSLAPVVEYNEDAIVSSDIVGSTASCIFDSTLTMAIPVDAETSLVKVMGWYDNEWGYSHRIIDLALVIGQA